MIDLSSILSPVCLARFMGEIHESTFLFIPGDEAKFEPVFSLEVFKTLLWQLESSLPQLLRVEQSGAKIEVPAAAAIVGKGHFRWAFERFSSGGTLILSDLDRLVPEFASLCRSVQSTMRTENCTAKAFLTPKGKQGFGAHFDLVDAFVLQIFGQKRWKVYEHALKLPAQGFPVDAGALGEPLWEEVLRPGDLLYMPRGFIHQACAEEHDSLHVTIGFRPFRWTDLLEQAMTVISEQVEPLRRRVPDGGRPTREQVKELTSCVVRALEDPSTFDTALARYNHRFVASLRPLPNSIEVNIPDGSQITHESLLEKRPGMLCYVYRSADEVVTIAFPGNFAGTRPGGFEAPPSMEAALTYIAQASTSFRPADLPGLSEKGQLVLARRLCVEGLLRLAA